MLLLCKSLEFNLAVVLADESSKITNEGSSKLCLLNSKFGWKCQKWGIQLTNYLFHNRKTTNHPEEIFHLVMSYCY
jgi:hypothetical protein